MFDVEEAREWQWLEDSDLAVAVLGLREQHTFIDLSGPIDRAEFDAAVADAKARGYLHCGYLRVKAGVPGVLCADPRGVFTMALAGMAWAYSMADYIRQEAFRAGEWDRFITGLHSLPDPRGTQWPN